MKIGINMYTCKECGSSSGLDVVIETQARLVQSSEGEIETSTDDANNRDHDWDDESSMSCTCGHNGQARDFKNHE